MKAIHKEGEKSTRFCLFLMATLIFPVTSSAMEFVHKGTVLLTDINGITEGRLGRKVGVNRGSVWPIFNAMTLTQPFDLNLPLGSSFFLVYPEANSRRANIIALRDWLMQEVRAGKAEHASH